MIPAKVHRAIEGLAEDEPEECDWPPDHDGSAKVALLGIERSHAAWLTLVERGLVSDGDAAPFIADLVWLRSVWDGPLLVKGILNAADARAVVEAGADAVVVSNHGGRQLDGVAATIDTLPEVVEAVGENVDVLVDGGIRRGVDVVVALALGARAVLVGRPVLWGLAVDGADGAERVLGLLRDELELALGLCGCCSPDDVTRAHVARAV